MGQGSSIHSTAKEGKMLELLKFLDAKADPNSLDDNRWTPLMLAAASGHLEAVSLLILRKASLEIKDPEGKTALAIAITSQSSNDNVIRTLINKGATLETKDSNGLTALMFAVARGSTSVAQLLLDSKANLESRDTTGKTPLFHSIANENSAQLLLKSKAHVDAVDNSGRSCLMYIAAKGRISSAKTLIAAKASLDIRDKEGKTALMYATLQHQRDMVKFFIEARAAVDITDKSGKTVLLQACDLKSTADVGIIRILADVKDSNGHTAVSHAAASGDVHLLQRLITAKASLDPVSIQGTTPLMRALQYNQVAAFRMLLDSKAQTDAVDTNGNTPLMQAALQGQNDPVQWLMDARASIEMRNEDGFTAMDIALDKKFNSVVRTLALAYDSNGDPALCAAAKASDTDRVQKLITAKVSLDVVNKSGQTALMLAILNGDIDIATLLLDSGAQLEILDNNGDSALIYAVATGEADIVRTLIDKKASIFVTNKQGRTAFDIALENDYGSIFHLLATATDSRGKNVVWVAAEMGATRLLTQLIAAKISVNVQDAERNTPLTVALDRGHIVAAQMLLFASPEHKFIDARPQTLAEGSHLCTKLSLTSPKTKSANYLRHFRNPLMTAILQRDLSAITTAMTRAPERHAVRDTNGFRPVSLAALIGNTSALAVFVNAGVALDPVNDDGYSPLMLAVRSGHVEAARLLIKGGAQINMCNERGDSA